MGTPTNAHTLSRKTTDFTVVKYIEERISKGHPPSQGAGTAAQPRFGEPLVMPTRFDLERRFRSQPHPEAPNFWGYLKVYPDPLT